MPKTYGTAGPRLIMPTICTSVPLASCSIEAQLLFERMISQADDQGRLQGEPRVVAALCMPLIRQATERNVRRWIGELASSGLIITYAADGRELIQLAGWWDNQGAPRRAYPSRHPAPNGWTDRVRLDGNPPPSRGQSADNPPPNGRQSADNSPLARALPVPSLPNPPRPAPGNGGVKRPPDDEETRRRFEADVQRTLAEISVVRSEL